MHQLNFSYFLKLKVSLARECDDLIELMHQTMAETKTKIDSIRKGERKEVDTKVIN